MTWFEESIFYHIYPLGLTDAPKQNDYGKPVNRIKELYSWIDHIQKLGFTGLYIGPLFESVGHGYETTDYRKVDSRLGTNDDLKQFVSYCHEKGIKVILDGVFNHTGRDFFAFKDIQKNRENSRYIHWYCNVNFYGNNEYNDGFSYDNWGGYNLLVKLNQRNPEVQQYICDSIRFWIDEFDIDGLRLDAADVLDFEFMKVLRRETSKMKEDFWLMGEVIHGQYERWMNKEMLHSVTNYALHKGLYSGHNEHNYFEIAHTVKRMHDLVGDKVIDFYNFVDNHDVERIYTKLQNKKHMIPVTILLYTLPGIPSVYYGSEFGIEGKKERYSDDSIRPALNLKDFKDNQWQMLFQRLAEVRHQNMALSYGKYKELVLTNRQYVFERRLDDYAVITAVNNDDQDAEIRIPASCDYQDMLSRESFACMNGSIVVKIKENSGMVLVPAGKALPDKPVEIKVEIKKEEPAEIRLNENVDLSKPYENMSVEELQAAIINKMAKNGPVTEQMKKDVLNNIWKDSLINWVKSFR